MMRIFLLLVTFFNVVYFSQAEDRESLENLMARIEQVPDHEPGSNKKEQEFVGKLAAYGQEAVPRLIETLAHPDIDVAGLAADALGSVGTLDEKYLPAIIKGLDRDISWLPNALGHVPTDAAAKEAVKRYLAASTSPMNQEMNAVSMHGARAIPFLLEALKNQKKQDGQGRYLLACAFGEMSSEVQKQAATKLVDVLNDAESGSALQRKTLRMFSNLHAAGTNSERALLALRDKEPTLVDAVDSALIGIRSTQAGEIYARKLQKNSNYLVLRDLAELGGSAKNAGGEVCKLLDSKDWEVRRAAARALGFIAYQEAIPKLMTVLGDDSDVIFQWIALQSLGRLQAEKAIPLLTQVAKNHWYPLVRQQAELALAHIKLHTDYELNFASGNFALEFFDYDRLSLKKPEEDEALALGDVFEPKKPHEIEKTPTKPADDLAEPDKVISSKKLQELAYPVEIISYRASDEKKQREEKGKDGIVEINESNLVKIITPEMQIPNAAMKVEGGYLASGNRGEWGGELVLIDEKGKTQIIINENVSDIFRLGDKYVALAGLAHMMSNSGLIYELSRNENGKWKAEAWRALPGDPGLSWLMKNGDLLITTDNCGTVVLSENGDLRMATETEEN